MDTRMIMLRKIPMRVDCHKLNCGERALSVTNVKFHASVSDVGLLLMSSFMFVEMYALINSEKFVILICELIEIR